MEHIPLKPIRLVFILFFFLTFLIFTGVITLTFSLVNAVQCLLFEENPVLKVQEAFIVSFFSFKMAMCVLVF